jgi:hypothetical protein
VSAHRWATVCEENGMALPPPFGEDIISNLNVNLSCSNKAIEQQSNNSDDDDDDDDDVKNPVQLNSYLPANLTVQRPFTKLAGIMKKRNTHERTTETG